MTTDTVARNAELKQFSANNDKLRKVIIRTPKPRAEGSSPSAPAIQIPHKHEVCAEFFVSGNFEKMAFVSDLYT